MGETFRYSPPEAKKPAPVTVDSEQERLEHSKTPEVKKDTKYEPSEQDAQKPPETDAQRRLRKMGVVGRSAMQGDDSA